MRTNLLLRRGSRPLGPLGSTAHHRADVVKRRGPAYFEGMASAHAATGARWQGGAFGSIEVKFKMSHRAGNRVECTCALGDHPSDTCLFPGTSESTYARVSGHPQVNARSPVGKSRVELRRLQGVSSRSNPHFEIVVLSSD